MSYVSAAAAPEAEPVAVATVQQDNKFTLIALLAAAVGLFAFSARKGR
jgi:hypothetical protein